MQLSNSPLAHWERVSCEQIPSGAIPLGRDTDGAPLFAARVHYNGSEQLGKARPGKCFIPYGGCEIELPWHHPHDILCGDASSVMLVDVRGHVSDLLLSSITLPEGGREGDGQRLYVGVCHLPNQGIQVGKCGQHLPGLNYSYGGQELIAEEFKIVSFRTPARAQPIFGGAPQPLMAPGFIQGGGFREPAGPPPGFGGGMNSGPDFQQGYIQGGSFTRTIVTPPRAERLCWHPASAGQIPHDAIGLGRDHDGAPLFAGRAQFHGGIQVGKARDNGLWVAYGGGEHHITRGFEVLCGDAQSIAWVSENHEHHRGHCHNMRQSGRPPVEAGREADGEPLFIGIAHHDRHGVQVGKCGSHLEGCHFALFGNEEISREYRVAVWG
ncbi:hypothetical protein BC830DRAFT_825814 [Chytriomyces sp. MP71]|nr:hypothetical protein BC830DRAFT_825814 [Chytriomyces sp. MP71]